MAIRLYRLTSAHRRQPCAQGQVAGNTERRGIHPNTLTLVLINKSTNICLLIIFIETGVVPSTCVFVMTHTGRQIGLTHHFEGTTCHEGLDGITQRQKDSSPITDQRNRIAISLYFGFYFRCIQQENKLW